MIKLGDKATIDIRLASKQIRRVFLGLKKVFSTIVFDSYYQYLPLGESDDLTNKGTGGTPEVDGNYQSGSMIGKDLIFRQPDNNLGLLALSDAYGLGWYPTGDASAPLDITYAMLESYQTSNLFSVTKGNNISNTVQIIVLGNSLTAQFEGNQWTDKLRTDLQAQYPELNIIVNNAAVSGAWSKLLLDDYYDSNVRQRIIPNAKTIFIFNEGINDFGKYTTTEAVGYGQDIYNLAVADGFDGIFMSTASQVGDTVGTSTAYTDDYNAKIRTATFYSDLIDWRAVDGLDDYSNTTYKDADTVHLTDAGRDLKSDTALPLMIAKIDGFIFTENDEVTFVSNFKKLGIQDVIGGNVVSNQFVDNVGLNNVDIENVQVLAFNNDINVRRLLSASDTLESYETTFYIPNDITPLSDYEPLVDFTNQNQIIDLGAATGGLTNELITYANGSHRVGYTDAVGLIQAGWHTVRLEWNDSDSNYRIFLDEVRVDNAYTGTPTKGTVFNFNVGKQSTFKKFTGQIHSSILRTTDDTNSHDWYFQEGAELEVIDSYGNGNDGLIQGSSLIKWDSFATDLMVASKLIENGYTLFQQIANPNVFYRSITDNLGNNLTNKSGYNKVDVIQKNVISNNGCTYSGVLSYGILNNATWDDVKNIQVIPKEDFTINNSADAIKDMASLKQ